MVRSRVGSSVLDELTKNLVSRSVIHDKMKWSLKRLNADPWSCKSFGINHLPLAFLELFDVH